MNRIFLLVLICLICLQTYAGHKKKRITYEEVTVGKNLLTNDSIIAGKHYTSRKIYKSFIDTVTGTLELQLRSATKDGTWMDNKGKLYMYQLPGNNLLWSKDINCVTDATSHFDSLLILNRGGRSYGLNVYDGSEKWNRKIYLLHIDTVRNIGIGYRTRGQSMTVRKMQGINLKDGNVLWERDVNNEFGWNDVKYLNDSVILIASQGLHLINIYNGAGWDYDTKTGKLDIGSIAISVGIAAVSSAAFYFAAPATAGIYYVPYISYPNNYIIGLSSNILVDKEGIFLASSNKLICFDTSGERKWITPLDKTETGISHIFIRDSLLYLVNEGTAFKATGKARYGVPYFAAYNISNGDVVFNESIGSRKLRINDFRIFDKEIVFLLDDEIATHSLTNGGYVSGKKFDVDCLNFCSGDTYIRSGDHYAAISGENDKNLAIMTTDGNIIVIDTDGTELYNIGIFDQYYLYMETGAYKFLENNSQTVVLNSSNDAVAELNASYRSRLVGKKLYDVNFDNYVEIDLSNVLK